MQYTGPNYEIYLKSKVIYMVENNNCQELIELYTNNEYDNESKISLLQFCITKNLELFDQLITAFGINISIHNNFFLKIILDVTYRQYTYSHRPGTIRIGTIRNDSSNEEFRYNVVKYLIDNGTDIHFDDEYALRTSARNGYSKIIKLLIENGANINVGDDAVLMTAVNNSNIELVKILIDMGANIHADNDYVLKISIQCGNHQMVKLLLDAGADSSKINYDTMLSSVFSGSLKTLEILLDYGIDFTPINSKTLTANKTKDFYKILNMLESNNVDIKHIMAVYYSEKNSSVAEVD